MATRAVTGSEFIQSVVSGGAGLVPYRVVFDHLEISRTRLEQLVMQDRLDSVVICDDNGTPQKGITADSLRVFLKEKEQSAANEVALEAEIYDYLMKFVSDHKKNGTRGETIKYGELMPKFGMSTRNPPDRKRIAVLLDRASQRSAEEHGFLISTVVVRANSGLPSSGYYQMWSIQRKKAIPLASPGLRKVFDEELALIYG